MPIMRNIALVAMLLALSQTALAARDPEIQGRMDQAVMDRYLNDHPGIASIVKRIDYMNFKIYLKNNCILIFNREFRFRLPGWVGGAASLQYSRKACGFTIEDNSE